MRRVNFSAYLALMTGVIGVIPCLAVGQDDGAAGGVADPSASSAIALTGQPFSAIKYRRRVKLLPDGKQRILSEINVMELARDTDGRVRMETEIDAPGCEHLGQRALQDCQVVNLIMFDPAARTITHWPEGEIAAHGAVVIQMSAGQVEDAENSTMTVPEYVSNFDASEVRITTEKLGSREMEGVAVTGVRTTTVLPTGYKGNQTPVTTIHEVWSSEAMKLVIRVIDGDPKKEVTISGLEHLSRTPDPSLFHPPDGYRITPSDRSEYVDYDITLLAEWGVK